ncbi:MAG: extracellular solute-binding protein [Hyphomonadaceae bacterium]
MRSVFSVVLITLFAACGAPEAPEQSAGNLNVYTARQYNSDQEIYKAFEEETGIRVRFRDASSPQLLETMKAEGDASPADIVIAPDVGTLWKFQDAGLLQPVTSDTLANAIPEKFRDPEGHWFGLARRARIIVYDPDRLNAEDISDYGVLADESMKGEVCMRSSSNIYNLSLMAELIERWGEEDAANWANTVRDNFAREPQGGDTVQIQSVAAGECSIAVVNHYYWVRMMTSDSSDQRDMAESTAIVFPSVGAGTHVNITGAGVAAHAPNKDAAIRFMEFLASERGQILLTDATKEFPIVEGTPLPTGLETLPDFISSDVPMLKLGENQSLAQTIYDKAGWK